jgi:hypothetical protein
VSYILLNEGAAPSTPASGKASLFVDSAGRLKYIGDDGVVNELAERYRDNAVRNSGMWFAQRQAPGTATTYSSTTGRAIGADGWGVTNENASATYRRVDARSAPETGLQSGYWGEYLKTTSAGKLHVSQVIEGASTAPLRGRTVRLQCKMKQVVAVSPVYRLGLVQLNSAGTIDVITAAFMGAFGGSGVDPTLGTNLARIAPKAGVSGDNCTANGNAYDCTLSSTWQRFGGVFDVPSDCRNLIVCVWSNAQVTATNGFGLSEVSLTDGYEITDWDPRALPLELGRCLRFYQKTFALDTAPAQNAGITTGALQAICGKAAATALAGQGQWRYPVNLRAAATTLTLYNPGAANAQARRVSGAAAADQTATVTANSTEHSADWTCTGDAAGTVGDRIIVHMSADAEL